MNYFEKLIRETVYQELSKARKDVDTNPTELQAKAGNYKKGHVHLLGFDITIENPKGSYRKGKDSNGREWKTLMHNDYGYFTKTVGKDGDAIDVFLGPNLESTKVFPIDQYCKNEFDETKVMLGFNTAEEAKAAYLSNYEKDWKGFKYITEVDLDVFKKWLYDGYRQRKPFAKYVRLTEDKERQLSIINDTNPMLDDYHTGIRKVDDIKTFEEAMAEAKADFDEYGTYSSYPDTPNSILEKALETGIITVYSSKPIKNGNFVTTSKMCAKDYAGGGKIFSETLPTSDIAWINVEEGQVARLNRLNESLSNRVYDAMEDYSHSDLLEEFVRDKRNGVAQKKWNLIPFERYRNVRERFLQEPAMARIPLNLVMSWFDIIVHNTLSISYITDFAGHSSYFPSEDIDYVLGREVEDYSDGWRVLDEMGFYDWAKLPDGSDGWSDYGLAPLYKIIEEFSENMSPGDILMLIDRALDVGHCRGNLASAFIEGGSKSCDNITSKQTLNESPYSADEIWYRGYDSQFGFNGRNENVLWLTDDIDYARCYGDRVAEVVIDGNKLNPASIDEMDEFCSDDCEFDYYDGPDDDTIAAAMEEGFNCYCFDANDDSSYCMCLWDNSVIKNIRELSEEETNAIEGYEGYDITPYRASLTESKKIVKNDEGKVVPKKCECGGDVVVQIHGEPVYVCKKCGKYFGTVPFTNESIDIKKALKNLKKRRDPANIENWDNDMINEAQGLKSKKLYDIFKQYGREFIAKHYDSSEAMDLHNVTDNDVVGVFKAGQLPKNEGEEKKWVAQMGFDIDVADGIRNIKLGKTSEDGQILYAVVINRNANFDRVSVEKDGGFKDYVDKKNLRAAGGRSDGAKEYQWKDNDVKFDVMDNPYRKEWNDNAQQHLQDRMKATYGDVYDKVKNVSESKESDKEIAKALRKGNREADIEAHGKPTAFRPTITKNPKAYTRKEKHKKKNIYLNEEQFKNYCRLLLREKRKEEYIKKLIKEAIEK